jgi:hypothetical protein
MEHLGSAHDEAELEALKAAARQRLAAGQGELDLGLDVVGAAGARLEIVSSRMGHLWDALCRAYEALRLDRATGGDAVFRGLVLTRIIEPISKLDSLRVLAEDRARRTLHGIDEQVAKAEKAVAGRSGCR